MIKTRKSVNTECPIIYLNDKPVPDVYIYATFRGKVIKSWCWSKDPPPPPPHLFIGGFYIGQISIGPANIQPTNNITLGGTIIELPIHLGLKIKYYSYNGQTLFINKKLKWILLKTNKIEFHSYIHFENEQMINSIYNDWCFMIDEYIIDIKSMRIINIAKNIRLLGNLYFKNELGQIKPFRLIVINRLKHSCQNNNYQHILRLLNTC